MWAIVPVSFLTQQFTPVASLRSLSIDIRHVLYNLQILYANMYEWMNDQYLPTNNQQTSIRWVRSGELCYFYPSTYWAQRMELKYLEDNWSKWNSASSYGATSRVWKFVFASFFAK